MTEWQDISTVPDLDRVIVAGWQKPSKRVAGYWWVHEDFVVNGKPDAHPGALLWQPFPSPPDLPSPKPSKGREVA